MDVIEEKLHQIHSEAKKRNQKSEGNLAASVVDASKAFLEVQEVTAGSPASYAVSGYLYLTTILYTCGNVSSL